MDYKAILLHNAEHEDTHVTISVPLSRYRSILTAYKTERAIFIEGAIENYIEKYKSYILSELNGKNNSYKIIKSGEDDVKGKCPDCKCAKKRYMNPRSGVCYYNEMITKDYTTKIKTN